MHFVRTFFAAACLMLTVIGPHAVAAPAGSQGAAAQLEGAAYIAGEWRITGVYDGDSTTAVNFTATFAPDGSFVDGDNYPGRWIISGATFTMFYPDESELGYVGAIAGDTISGRFRGLSNSGTFRMSRAGV